MDSNGKIEHIRHSLAHLLAAAVLELYPDTKPTIGPAIDSGFYYDFEFKEPISEKDLPKIEQRMKEILKTWDKFTSKVISERKAKEIYGNNPYKIELIEEISHQIAEEKITLYTSGKFTDLCRGGHAQSAKDIDPESFELDRIAGAYWRGDEKNTMLTRIYGLAFNTKKELDAYIIHREEAKKRDHRKIGKELDLFIFSDLVGSGLPLFTPKGNRIRESIIQFSQELNSELGFEEVHTPNFNRADLFKISGHYDKYKEDMFSVRSQYSDEDFLMKPMNCPQHTQIYASRPRSYRELPIRYADFAVLYRDERPGELSGLSRLRSFAQDDGHVFCREDQIEEEISNILKAIQKALKTYKIDYWMRLSLRDPHMKNKYLGTDQIWENSQSIMRKLLRDHGITHKEAEGEAAFYGPKIDIMAVDALGREWQLSTVQLDFNQPSRFKLVYADKDGTDKTPVMIHRALVGSPDRFMGNLIEHFAGAFPLWLSPVQVIVVPISEKFETYAKSVFEKFKSENIRVEIDMASESLGKRIRQAETQKTPYIIIVGEKEETSKNVSVRARGGKDEGAIDTDKFIKRIQDEIKRKA